MKRHQRRGDLLLPILTALLLTSTAAFAQVPAAKPAPAAKPVAATPAKPAATPNPAIEAARLVYEALPLADRVAIQDGLVWTGDYSGSLDGTFGRMTFEAIAAFQARHRFAADGILTAPALKLLADTAATRKTAVGFQPVDDKATGVRIHLPTKVLGPAMKRDGGTRWVGREGRIQVDTFAHPDADLAQLFERMKAEAPGRKVVYAVMRTDWFVVSDETGARHGYARFVRGPEGVRGFVFSVDAAIGPEFDRVVIATAGRFEPFPGTVPVAGPTTTPTTPTTPAQPPVAAPTTAAASGLLVAPGRVITSAAAVAGCRTLSVAGRPATVATADAGGLATLAVTGGPAGALRLAAAAEGPLTVVASGESGGRAALVAVAGESAAGRLRAALQRGAHGAPVLDAHGALVGLVAGRPDEARAVAGLVPPASYDLLAGEPLAAALTAAGATVEPAAADTLTTGRLVAAWSARVVAVDCRR